MTQLLTTIRQEIESNIKAFDNSGIYDAYEAGELAAYQELLSFIESLEKEQAQGLDEAAEEYGKEHTILPDNYNDGDIPDYENLTADAFRAGAKWMAEQWEVHEVAVESPVLGPPMVCCPVKNFSNGDKVRIQITKI